MSDGDVLRIIERMESWLQQLDGLPEAETLAEWDHEFQAAVTTAERGPGWSALVERAHAAGALVEAHAATLAVQRDRVRDELDAQERGGRALKGYGAVIR